jgi:hypothetical protein
MLTALDAAATRNRIALGHDEAAVSYLTSTPTPLSLTAATVTLNPTTHGGGRPLLLNKADGIAATLPPATGSGEKYLLIVQTSVTSVGYIISVGRAADTMIGAVTSCTLAGSGSLPDGVGGTDDTITMAAGSGTQGGLVGSWVELTDIVANLWFVRGAIIGTGTMVTSFSAAVS